MISDLTEKIEVANEICERKLNPFEQEQLLQNLTCNFDCKFRLPPPPEVVSTARQDTPVLSLLLLSLVLALLKLKN